MTDTERRQAALSGYIEALTCSPSVYTWRYSPDRVLLSTNCPEDSYHLIFEHTGCLDYAMASSTDGSSPLILSRQLGIMWAAVYEQTDSVLTSVYIIGPVMHDEVEPKTLEESFRRHNTTPSVRLSILQALQDIPAVSSVLFFQYAVMFHFYVTGEKISRSDLRFQKSEISRRAGATPQKSSRRKTYQGEQALLQYIRDGNPDYRNIFARVGQMSSGIGVTTKDPFRRAVLSASNFAALCTRAAIEGGLSPDTAYTVGDSYIQSFIECETVTELPTLIHEMYDDFIQRVNKLKNSEYHSPQIRQCVQYIETHLDEDLSLEGLANEIGYSGCHLSRKFKAETGMTIRDYTKSVRIKRAQLLLTTTDMSIAEIAEHLRFCSSSHFSDAFRDVTGMLPGTYRKENI